MAVSDHAQPLSRLDPAAAARAGVADAGGRRPDASWRAERGPVESIEDLVARRELSAVVEEAMALLPEEQRTAIILKDTTA